MDFDGVPQPIIGDPHAEMGTHALPEEANLIPVPFYLILFVLLGQREKPEVGGIHLTLPVIVDTSDMIAAVDPNDAIEKAILTLQSKVQGVADEAAVDTADAGVRKVCFGAPGPAHSEWQETRSRYHLHRHIGAVAADYPAPLVPPLLQRRIN
jgi:hypothetical protein